MNTVVKRILAGVLAGALLVSSSGLAACANEAPVEEPAPIDETEELRTIGTPSEDALEITATNDTGKDIVALAVKTSQDEAFGNSLITKKEKIEDGETVLIYIPAEAASVDSSASESSGAAEGAGGAASNGSGASAESTATTESDNPAADVVLRTLYNVKLTFDDDATAELHDINLKELSEVTVLLTDDGIAYIEYENSSGKTESTLETEKALKQAEEAAAEAAAQAAAQAEADAAAAAAQAEADAAAAAAAAASSQYDYGYSYDTGSGGYTGTQDEGVCIPESDLVFN